MLMIIRLQSYKLHLLDLPEIEAATKFDSWIIIIILKFQEYPKTIAVGTVLPSLRGPDSCGSATDRPSCVLTPSNKSFLFVEVPQSCCCCRHGVEEVSKVATEWLTSALIQELSGEPGS